MKSQSPPGSASVGPLGCASTCRSRKGLRCAPIDSGIFWRSIRSKRKRGFACRSLIDVAPCQGEPLRTHAVGEMLGQQGCIVVAQLPPQPGQPPDPSAGLDRKLQNEEQLTIAVATKHDGGDGAAARADAPLPGSEPIEGLEFRPVGVTLECFPILLDNVEIAIDVEIDARSGGRVGKLGTGGAHRRRGGPGQAA